MPRTLSFAALVMLSLTPAASSAQNARTNTQGRMTVMLRMPAWLGLALQCEDCTGRRADDLTRQLPVITRILPDGPAARASLQVGDTIVSVDGKRLSVSELRARISESKSGSTFQFVVGSRRGRSTVNLTADSAPIAVLNGDSLPIRYRGEFAQLTVDVMSMTPPVVTRDSAGAMVIRIGEHVLRLQQHP